MKYRVVIMVKHPPKPNVRTVIATKLALSGAVMSAVLWATGCGGNGSGSNSYGLSVTRVMAINLGALEYSNDYDDGLPLKGKWVDEDLPYAKDETQYHSPAVGTKGYGYAYNSDVVGKVFTQFSNPATEITIFDSTDLSRNATDLTSTEPSPPRYGRNNTVGYLDGHVQDQGSAGNPPPTLYVQSKDRLKQVGLGILMYANDWNEDAPLANQWEDELLPYVKQDLLFHSPAVQYKNATEYGYALNSALAGLALPTLASPSTTISIFDSTVLIKNATASITTLPNPPRYGKLNTIVHADGHVGP